MGEPAGVSKPRSGTMREIVWLLMMTAGCASMPPQRIEAECKTLAAEVRVSYAIGLEAD
jgi:hypothetical protein